MQLTGAEHTFFGGCQFYRVEIDLVDGDFVCIPVVWVFHSDKDLVGCPFFDGVCTVTHKVLSAGPLGAAFIHRAELFYRFLLYREHAVVIQQFEEVRNWRDQLELKRLIIEGGDTDFGEVFDLTFVEFFGVLENVKRVSVLVTQCRHHGTLIRVNEILSRDRVAIGPLGVITDLEGVDRAVFRDRPAFSGRRYDFKRLGVFGNQSFEKSHLNTVFGHTCGDVRVYVRDFRAVTKMEDAHFSA